MIPAHDMRGITGADLAGVHWRKSSRSNNGGECVEVAALSGVSLARDSKDPDGPVLALGPASWASFIESVKTGSFDLT